MTRASNVKPEIGLAAGSGGISGGGDGRAVLTGLGAERNGASVRSGTIGGDGTSGVIGAGCRSSCARRLLANWPMICAAVAWIMPTPRPYCATAPDSIRSVWITTFEPVPAGSMRKDFRRLPHGTMPRRYVLTATGRASTLICSEKRRYDCFGLQKFFI